ncbi:MAG: hypothetical protein RL600_740 [Actinomycetota bacterium]
MVVVAAAAILLPSGRKAIAAAHASTGKQSSETEAKVGS